MLVKGATGSRGRGNHKNIFGEAAPPMGVLQMRNLLTRSNNEILLELSDPRNGFKEEMDAIQPNHRPRFGLPLLLMGRAFSTNAFPKAF